MPVSYVDQFFLIDAAQETPSGTPLPVNTFTVIDNNDDNLIGDTGADTIDGVTIGASFPGDTLTVQLPDGNNIQITGITFYLSDDRVVFTPTDGSVLQDSTFLSSTFVLTRNPLNIGDLGPACFTAGTLIETDKGPKAVETLTSADHILGHDGQKLSLTLLLNRTIGPRDLMANPKLRPVRIMAGALGNGLPVRDLLVSRQHRVLIRSEIAKRMFGSQEVLIPAIKLTPIPGIFVDDSVQSVEYYHILFDKHEIILSEGAATESLFTGPEALKSISPEAREEIFAIFPEIADINYQAKPACYIPSGRDQKRFVALHVESGAASLG